MFLVIYYRLIPQSDDVSSCFVHYCDVLLVPTSCYLVTSFIETILASRDAATSTNSDDCDNHKNGDSKTKNINLDDDDDDDIGSRGSRGSSFKKELPRRAHGFLQRFIVDHYWTPVLWYACHAEAITTDA